MVLLIVLAFGIVLASLVRSRLSVENPGKLQILLEDGVGAVLGLLDENGSGRRAPLPAARRRRSASSS